MMNIENLSELLAKAERELWGKNISNAKERRNFIAEYLVSNNVTIQIEAEWESYTEIRNNTVCGDGVKIQYKRCSNCKQPMGLTEECFCCKCGAKMKGANNNGC